MFAISPRGIGNAVGARAVRSATDDLVGDETFIADWAPGMVLAEDEVSLRMPSDAELLARAKENRKAYITIRYEAELVGGVVLIGETFDATETAINAVVSLAWNLARRGDGSRRVWFRLPSGRKRLVNASQLETLADALIDFRDTQEDNEETKHAAIDAAATIPEVEAVDW